MSSTSTTWTTDTNTKSGTVQIYDSSVSTLRITAGESTDAILELFADEGDDNADKWRLWVNDADDDLHFANYTSGAWADLLTIQDGGNVGIGTSSPNAVLHIAAEDTTNVKGLRVQDSTDSGCDTNNVLAEFAYSNDTDLDGAFFCRFMESDGAGGLSAIGGITGNSDATTFATSSDYRLKEDFKDIVDATGTINQLKLYDFKWKKSGKRKDGVIAHEADAIYPNAVTGKKDAIDLDGKISPQMVDYSKFVPLLLKAIQELSAKVEALENA